MTDDELEQRKEETWSMDEIRSGAVADTADVDDPSDTADTNGTESSGGSQAVSVERSETADADDQDQGQALAEPEAPEELPNRAVGPTVRAKSIDADGKGLSVRDLHNVNVYLYEDVYEDMVTTFKQLDSEYYRAHGDDLSKNKDFFNAVFRAGIDSPKLREELELD